MPADVRALSDLDFMYVRDLAKNSAGIVIEPDKRYLVETRLSPLADAEGFSSLAALIAELRRSADLSGLHVKAIDALTTNETLFFRDRHPFDALGKVILPELIEARRPQRRLRIWSAASSTGQEAYSIAMLIRDKFPELASWNVAIIGTDISDSVLSQARLGIYGQHEINRGLPAPMLVKYFTQSPDARWTIKPEVRSMVQFWNMNLNGRWLESPPFDLVFLRNVLIYFDAATKRSILTRVAERLAPGGYVALGSAETPGLASHLIKPVTVEKTVFYQVA